MIDYEFVNVLIILNHSIILIRVQDHWGLVVKRFRRLGGNFKQRETNNDLGVRPERFRLVAERAKISYLYLYKLT